MVFRRYWVFSFMGHFLSAVILVLFIMLFISALMMVYTLRVCVCVFQCNYKLCWWGNVFVYFSSVHRGVCPRSLRVSWYMPVWARMGRTGLLQWWGHFSFNFPVNHLDPFISKWLHSQLVHKTLLSVCFATMPIYLKAAQLCILSS